jgi:hypothetical protein
MERRSRRHRIQDRGADSEGQAKSEVHQSWEQQKRVETHSNLTCCESDEFPPASGRPLFQVMKCDPIPLKVYSCGVAVQEGNRWCRDGVAGLHEFSVDSSFISSVTPSSLY